MGFWRYLYLWYWKTIYTCERIFFVEQNINLFYGPRNSSRLDDYHRMDLSATYTPRPNSKRNGKGVGIFRYIMYTTGRIHSL